MMETVSLMFIVMLLMANQFIFVGRLLTMRFEDYINILPVKTSDGPRLKALTRNKKVKFLKLPFKPYCFILSEKHAEAEKLLSSLSYEVEIERVDAIQIDCKKFCSKISVEYPYQIREVRELLESHGIQTFESDLPYSRRLLLDLDEHLAKPEKILYLDIETDSREKFAREDEAESRILSIAAVDHKENEFFFSEDNEAKMIEDFLELAKKYELIEAWNAKYDITYIVNRAKKLGIDVGHVIKKGRQTYIFEHPHMDSQKVFMNIFKRKVRSYALKIVAQDFLGYSSDEVIEIETREDMWKLWNSFISDKRFLRKYNLQDCYLLKEIDEKAQLLNIQHTVMKICSLESYDPKGQGTCVEALLLKEAAKEEPRLVLRNRLNEEESESSYTGGYVKDPKPGIHKNLFILDIESTYPAIIRTFNVGIDTYRERKTAGILAPHGSFVTSRRSIFAKVLDKLLGLRKDAKKTRDQYHPDSLEYKIWDAIQFAYKFIINCFTEDHYVLTPDGFKKITDFKVGDKVYTLNPETLEVEVDEVVNVHKYYYRGKIYQITDGKNFDVKVTPNHRLFLRRIGEESFDFVLAENLNGKYEIICKDLNFVVLDSSSHVSAEDFEGYVYCITAKRNHVVFVKRRDKCCWIGQSTYGVMGDASSRVYKREVAENITLYCRFIIKFVDSCLSRLKNLDVIYGDTDGLTVKVLDSSLTDEELNSIADFVKDQVNLAIQKVVELEFGVPEDKNEIRIKVDRVCRSGYFPEVKKRYILHVIREGSKDVDYYHVKGFDCVKSNVPMFCRKLQREILEMILQERSMKEIAERLEEYKQRLFSGEADEELVLYMRLNKKPDEYDKKTRHAIIARQLEEMGYNVSVGDKIPFVSAEDEYYPFIPGKTKLSRKFYEKFWRDRVLSVLENIGLPISWEDFTRQCTLDQYI